MTREQIRSDGQMRRYFDSLPAFVQESMIQSGVTVNTLEELRQCAQHLLNRQ